MATTFSCPGCGRPLSSGDEQAGKSTQCPHCNKQMMVPAADAARAAEAGNPDLREFQPPPAPAPSGGKRVAMIAAFSLVAMLAAWFLYMTIEGHHRRVGGPGTDHYVRNIANACETYFVDFQAYPGVLSDAPDNPDGRPSKVSGSQDLRLGLLGCSRSGRELTRKYQGPAEDMDKYGDADVRIYEAHYAAGNRELVPHRRVAVDTDPDYDGDIEVFVDYRYRNPRPILYYRARPRYEGTSLFEFDDNAVYCDPARGETAEAFSKFLSSISRQTGTGFLLISAGPDRIYFTEDDITCIGH